MVSTRVLSDQNKQYEQFLIAEHKYWSVYLHENQSYLGRMVIWSHRTEFIDIFMLERSELEELTVICRSLKRALDSLFHPDLYNWASFANVLRHQHVHLIPRYRHPVAVLGRTFTDTRWGMNHAPAERKVLLEEHDRDKLLELIRSRIIL